MTAASQLKLGIVMDRIESINPNTDSTLAMMVAAQKRGWSVVTMDTTDLRLRDGVAEATMRQVSVSDRSTDWHRIGHEFDAPLTSLDILLMRKDPPFDLDYITATYVLERAEEAGVLVVNRPRAIRDANEKVFASWFPSCCPPTLISSSIQPLKAFLHEHQRIVVKPLDLMGGRSVFVVSEDDLNANVILEEMTRRGTRFIQAQRFVPEVLTEGDKRILLVNGEPVPHALVRKPSPGDSRANMAAGGTATGGELSERDLWICQQIGPQLRERGLVFVGIDVIGGFLTEINVTSPTGIRQLDRLFNLDIASHLLDVIQETVLTQHNASLPS